jgi:aerobic C4-dicarboxylate transport protein
MSEARALTNFAGNSVATVLVATWTDGLDRERFDRVLDGELPFDETDYIDDDREPVPTAAAQAEVASSRSSA